MRTPQEFGEGHIEGAEMLDFSRDDFRDQLALLDEDGRAFTAIQSIDR